MTPIKKIVLVGCLLMTQGVASLSAALLVDESFNYANGSLNAKSGGTGFSGNWSVGTNGTGSVNVVGGAAVVAGANATWASRNVSPVTGSSFYFSYDVSSVSAATLTERSFLDVLVFKSGSAIAFQSGIYYDKDGLRLRAVAGGVDTNLTTAVTTTVNTVYTVVGKFTFDDGAGNAVLSIWINPTSESSSAVYTQSWQSSLTSVTQIVIQRYDGYVIGEGTSTSFDNIRIGTDWTSVTPIPEPSASAALMGIACTGWLAMRRRR